MSQQNSKPGPSKKPRDPDLAGAEAAMKRAARKAQERARQVGSAVVVWQEGVLIEEQPESSDSSGV